MTRLLAILALLLLAGCATAPKPVMQRMAAPVRDAGEAQPVGIAWTYFGASNDVPIWGVATVTGTDAASLTLERSDDLQSWQAVTNCNYVRGQTNTVEVNEPLLDREFWRWRLQ